IECLGEIIIHIAIKEAVIANMNVFAFAAIGLYSHHSFSISVCPYITLYVLILFFRPEQRGENMKPKIGLALGAGGARGLAHIGVIQVLEEHRISVDMVAGSSIGSLVGALYAMGHDGNTLARFAQLCREKFFYDFTVSKMGIIQGNKIKELLSLITQRKRIEELPIPLAIVATNLTNGEKVLFREGYVADAICASISIPGIFVPVEMDGKLLVDGSVVDRVPVSVVKQMGADIIIAVDISTLKKNVQVNSIVDVMLQSIDIM